MPRPLFLEVLAKAQHYQKQYPSIVYGVFLLASGAFGLGALSCIEKIQSEAQRETPLRPPNADFPEGKALQQQNEALATMLRGLKHKTFREKIEAAADAQDKFMGPQYATVVSQTSPQQRDRRGEL